MRRYYSYYYRIANHYYYYFVRSGRMNAKLAFSFAALNY